ncbi:MAG: HEAT repeat domain-containing protein [Armatimonas sp.]
MDEWGPPQKEHWSANWSANRRFVLKVSWVSQQSDGIALHRRDGNKMTRLWTRPYPQKGPPYSALVTNDGQHVILRDVHGELGYGKVLVFLGPDGKELKSYQLDDLLTLEQHVSVPLTTSSLHWSYPGIFIFLDNEKTFGFLVSCGASSAFDVATGQMFTPSPAHKAALHQLAIKEARAELQQEDKTRGLFLIEAYRLPELLPTVRSFLKDNGNTGQCAARTLSKLAPSEAISLLKTKLNQRLSQEAQKSYLQILGGIDQKEIYVHPPQIPLSPTLLSLWQALSKNPSATIRQFALISLCERESSTYLLQHPEFLKSSHKELRYAYIRALSERGTQVAIPLLHKGLKDSEDANRFWAFRGLVRFKAPDLLPICRNAIKNPKCGYSGEALIALAAHGDPAGNLRLQKEFTHLDLFTFGLACELIARQKRREFIPALRQYRKKWDTDAYFRELSGPHCIGAMAACGDVKAQQELLQHITKGKPMDRATALEYVRYVRTPAAIALARTALVDRDPYIRNAARKALGMAQ